LIVSVNASAQARVSAHEGRLEGNTPIAVDDQRVSVYSGAREKIEAAAPAEKKFSAGAAKLEPKRAPLIALSEKSSWYRIYDAGSTLRRDRDGDGHHSEFQIRFDADSLVGDALVYAKLYLRRVGDTGGWQFYHATDDFWIFGQSGTDDYYVTTTLDDGFPTGEYDVLIDLYESGHSGIVATLTAYDDESLASLPLEENALDVPYDLPGFSVRDVSTTLLIDGDQDGFYSRFRIAFDPDSDVGSSTVYAIVWIRPQGGDWIKEHESNDFDIDSSGTADAYSFTADWISGYPTARYDVQLDLHDAKTGLLVASAGSERPEFSRIPLEDQSKDRFVNAPPPNAGASGGSTSSYEDGGGSLTLWSMLALLGLLALRSGSFANRGKMCHAEPRRTRRLEIVWKFGNVRKPRSL
jgi:hypothetical protein